jgi:hypothetical protein
VSFGVAMLALSLLIVIVVICPNWAEEDIDARLKILSRETIGYK